MSYTRSMIEQAVDVLTRRIPGLTREAAAVWVRAEQGVNNNVLGVTDGRGHLFSYPTLVAGAAAAAALFNNSSYYVKARRDVAGSSDPGAQLRAIAASPWNGGHYKNSTVFKPYLQGATLPRRTLTQTPGATPPAPPATSTESGGAGGAGTLAAYLGRPATDKLTVLMLNGFLTRAAKETGEKRTTLFAFYADFVGHTLGTIAAPGQAFTSGTFGGAVRSPDPVEAVTDAVWAFVPGLAVNLAVLATVLILGYRGVRAILG